MGLNISYTCNWCNHKVETSSPTPPEGWKMVEIHNPNTGDEQKGSFCKPLCQENYGKLEPAAIEHAQHKYAEEFYSYLNKEKQT